MLTGTSVNCGTGEITQFPTAPLTQEEIAARQAEARAALQWEVKVEANRRLGLGFDHDFADARGVHRIGTTEADLKGWDEVSKGAQAAINLGAPNTPINVLTDTGPVAITAMEWQFVLASAMAARQPIFAASFALQAMDPIPADFADDSYWGGQ